MKRSNTTAGIKLDVLKHNTVFISTNTSEFNTRCIHWTTKEMLL
jgi:hypothetical protein